MDKKQLEMVLQLAEEKKRELEAVISSIREQLSGVPQDTIQRRRKRTRGNLGPAASRIRDCLAKASSLMSPSDISEQLTREGANIKVTQIRNLLRRYKNDLFESPAHGQWKIKGRSFSIDSGSQPFKGTVGIVVEKRAQSKDEDDLPF